MTTRTLQSLLAENPWLAAIGFNPDSPHTLQCCNAAEAWLWCCGRAEQVDDATTTYVLKRRAEPIIGYVTDGEFCASAIALGFTVTPCGSSAVTDIEPPKGEAYDVSGRVYDAAFRMVAETCGMTTEDEINTEVQKAGDQLCEDGSGFTHRELTQMAIADAKLGWGPPASTDLKEMAHAIRDVLTLMPTGEGIANG